MLTKAFINNLFKQYCDRYDMDYTGQIMARVDSYRVVESVDDGVGGLTLQILIYRAEGEMELFTITLSPTKSELEYSLNVSDHFNLYNQPIEVNKWFYENFKMGMIELFAPALIV
jgi:hypothetical protein